MIRLVFSILFSTMVCGLAAQIEFGLKAGLSSTDLTDKDLYIDNEEDANIGVTFQDASYGMHFGLYTRVSFLGVYLEPSFLFNSQKVDYNLREEIFDTGVVNTAKSENFSRLDIPVLVGYKLGIFRLQAGPVAHIQLDGVSDLTNTSGYSEKINNATYGYQLGAGIDILKVRLDFNYEGGLSGYSDHINIGNTAYTLADRPSRLVATLGYKF